MKQRQSIKGQRQWGLMALAWLVVWSCAWPTGLVGRANAVAATTTGKASAPDEAASGKGAPEVASVEPSSVTPGSALIVKLKGRNFAVGARASFSNPGIRVLDTKVEKSSQLAVHIQVASNATTGVGSLFVVNPDDSEAEARFDVTAGSPVVTATGGGSAQPATTTSPGSTTASTGTGTSSAAQKSAGRQFEVYSLGNVASVLGGGSKTKGTLTFASGKLKYLEADKEVFAASRKDVKEIGVNAILGVNTGTFHVILNSGKTYNFIATTFRPADSQSIVDALRSDLR
jgi:hypothetical protein